MQAEPPSTSTSTSSPTTTDAPAEAADAIALEFGAETLTFDELDELFAAAPSFLPNRAEAATSWLIARAGVRFLADAGMPVSAEQLDDSRVVVAQDGSDPSSLWGEVQVDLHAVSVGLQALANERALAEVTVAPEVLCSSHILLETEADAVAARDRAAAGEDFAELARELSTGPSGPAGGDLGCGLTSAYVPEFSAGARDAGIGVSPPVESQFGWHVIEVRSIGPASVENHPELDQSFVDDLILRSESVLAQSIWQDQLSDVLGLIDTDGFVDPAIGTWNPDTTRIDAA